MATPANEPAAPHAAIASRPHTLTAWAWLLLLLTAFVALHFTFLRRVFLIATSEYGADWSHAVLLPPLAAWLVYRRRHELFASAPRPNWLGLPVMLVGVLAHLAGIYPIRNDMAQGYAMLVTLAGAVLLTLGTRGLRIASVPTALLALGVKISDRWWDAFAWQLQVFAANGAAAAFHLLGIDAQIEGSMIDIARPGGGAALVNVAEACAGLRMLMSFIVLAVLVAFVPRRFAWQRVVIVALAVPVAITVNIARVAFLGVAHVRGWTWATESLHGFIGVVMLPPALAILLAVAWMLDRLFVPDATRVATSAPQSSFDHRNGAAIVLLSPLHARSLTGAALGAALMATIILALWLAVLAIAPLPGSSLTQSQSLAGAAASVAAGIAVCWALRRLAKRSASADDATARASSDLAVPLACAAGILVASALGLGSAVRFTGAVLQKSPVPLRAQLTNIPRDLPGWTTITDATQFPDGVIEQLRTTQFLYRVYAKHEAPSEPPIQRATLHIAYYTGSIDTVPHVAERCFVAQGARAVAVSRVELDLVEARSRDASGSPRADVPDRLAVTLFEYEQGGRVGSVVYFFIANGRFLATPDELRLRAFDLRERTSYYCKIEMTFDGPRTREGVVNEASAFLGEVLPELLDCLPAPERAAAAHEARP